MDSEKARVGEQGAGANSSTEATPEPAQLQSRRPSITQQDEQDEQDPPQYFDSEPSSQPPSYNKYCGQASSSKRNSGPASAASIAAILGPPPEKRKKMSLKERWKDLIHNGGHSGADGPGTGSAHSKLSWNVGQADFLAPKKKKG